MRKTIDLRRIWLMLAATPLTGLVVGCGLVGPNTVIDKTPIVVPLASMAGVVHGGLQPVSGAAIQLYAVGNTGSMSASTPLISQAVVTGSDGSFQIAGLWNCTNTAVYGVDPLLYLVATGGKPGAGAGGSANPALAMMTALGRCSTVASGTIFVNEVTTVASVYALAPFMSDYGHVGASAANMAGLANAFGSVGTLADVSSGVTPGPGALVGETVPTREINSLADVLNACVNSNGAGACTSLFAATSLSGGSAPKETIAALLRIARSPSLNVAALYGLASATGPFTPALSNAPGDWTLMLKFTGGGLSAPAGVAIDASGDAWIANSGGSSVTEINSQGAFLTGVNGFSSGSTILGAQGIAVDRLGNVWLADPLLSSVVKLTLSSGTILSSASFTNSVDGPVSLAVDSQNNVWVANFAGGSVTELSNNGVPVGASPLTASGTLRSPAAVAIDASGNVWVSDNSGSVVAQFDKNQKLLSGSGYSDRAMLAPLGVAVDAAGNLWVAGSGNNGASLFNASGASAVSVPFLGGGLSMPSSVAIDGAGAAWLTNGGPNGSLSVVPSAGGSATGALGAISAPAGVAVDASGNLWTANTGDDSVSKFVGAATPVASPLAATVGP